MLKRLRVVLLAALVAAATSITLDGQFKGTFPPDWTFTGSALSGTQQIGQAAWRAENGEIIGTPKAPAGGWLLLADAYQDLQFSASFRCASSGCVVGVLFRAEKTADGFKGLFAPVAGPDRGGVPVTLDPQGRIIARATVEAPAGRGGGGGGRGGGGGGRGGGTASTFVSMFSSPSTAFREDDWNQLDFLVTDEMFRGTVNGGAGFGGAAPEGTGYGPVALFVGGTSEVRFKDVSVRDLRKRTLPAETVSPRFHMVRFEDFYTGWSAAAGDFNRDGIQDVTMGHRYYLGPSFTESYELYTGPVFNPGTEYSRAMVNYAFDVTGDGWDDILVVENRPPVLYVNPRGESRRWTRHEIFPQVTSESIMFTDVNGDGTPDAIFVGSGLIQWASVDRANPTGPWKVYAVSDKGPWGVHGIGAGDINGDGRVDIIAPHGWWEQPAAGATQVPWTFHQAAFGRNGNAGGNFGVYDVNGDGLPDIVTALQAHGFGLAWYEQKRDSSGKATWLEHVIMGGFADKNAGDVTFTQPHALDIADIDGDGIPDIVTGKRHWSHLDTYNDPDPHGAPVLYWYRTVRNPKAPGGAEFVPELIHNRSGVGSMVQIADMNGDGRPDVLAGTNRGGFVFLNSPRGR